MQEAPSRTVSAARTAFSAHPGPFRKPPSGYPLPGRFCMILVEKYLTLSGEGSCPFQQKTEYQPAMASKGRGSSFAFGLLSDSPEGAAGRIAALYAILAAANIATWAWAFVAFRDYPLQLGTAFLAYTFGLRHAVDADHIAAIDNVTRKLMQEGKRPAAVGFFFSLGHSTVVIAAAILIALTASSLQRSFPGLIEAAGLVGTFVSVIFLFAIATINLVVLIGVFRVFRRAKRGEDYAEDELNVFLAQRGLLSRLFRTLFRLISRSWHMYPLGFLFGLGFDTATEIGLLGISAAEAQRPVYLVDPGISGVVHRRHVAGRYQRRLPDGRRLWLGVFKPAPQALL